MGLATRYKLEGTRARVYTLTEKGWERLHWLQEQVEEDELDLIEEDTRALNSSIMRLRLSE
jgi:DNA-binding PadR family transcriptional regulator